ncbi:MULTISPECIES: spherulation-specific family 4 protein [unclassified Simplicispira]|uniref:spherulation-specific family 4 protein n=1 Tax=unclassified Simplicispira TaxID=2630407 RepID=UPI000D5C5753|nr:MULTISPECIES: spherulation-specific family 4 protein [unclassified Simplicispira]PVY55354.1 spherulation-specific family 4 protein [Simplicispira sp. 125]REG16297.1 spherulation-specific family 4 protein [Simplicispira sp. 110]
MHHHVHSPYRLAAAPLFLAAMLAGCGGGTEKNPPVQPPPSGVVSLRFLNDIHANVFDQGSTSNTLSVQATKDGGNADDVTVVFSATQGTTSPVSVLPRGGIASTTLSVPLAATTGAMSITAKATATNTVLENFAAYVRPAPDKLQVLVPAYFSASTNAAVWTALTTAAQSYPDVQINVIVKPDNAVSGIIPTGTYTPDSALVTAIGALKTAHPRTKVLGYIATGGGTTGTISLTDVQTTIDQYSAGYGTKIDGFYLDGMAVDRNLIASFYQPLTARIAEKTGLGTTPPLVVGNPATYPAKEYAALVNVLVTHSGSATNYQTTDPQTASASWVYDKQNVAQAMQVHSASTCSDMKAAVARAHLPRMNTGWIFVTDQAVGAPWSTLPATAYWKSFLGTVDATNKGNPLPTC